MTAILSGWPGRLAVAAAAVSATTTADVAGRNGGAMGCAGESARVTDAGDVRGAADMGCAAAVGDGARAATKAAIGVVIVAMVIVVAAIVSAAAVIADVYDRTTVIAAVIIPGATIIAAAIVITNVGRASREQKWNGQRNKENGFHN